MGAETGIAWTDHTFNPWWGCEKISPGCANCYAAAWDRRWGGEHWGKLAPRRFFGTAHWREPLKWNADAHRAGRRAKVFCASMADVFEDRRDLDPSRMQLWALIRDTPHLDWQLLTKRPENILKLLPEEWRAGLPRNVWVGCTVEDQKHADERVPELLKVPAVVRFLSVEPLLERVSLARFLWPTHWHWDGAFKTPEEALAAGAYAVRKPQGLVHALARFVDWGIVGGESGPGARPCALEWIEDVVRDFKAAGRPVFVKQLGAYVVSEARTSPVELMPGKPEEYTKHRAPNGEVWAWRMGLDDAKGGDIAEFPDELKVRQFPEVRHG